MKHLALSYFPKDFKIILYEKINKFLKGQPLQGVRKKTLPSNLLFSRMIICACTIVLIIMVNISIYINTQSALSLLLLNIFKNIFKKYFTNVSMIINFME